MKILLQTNIRFVADDWHIGRFSALQKRLPALTTEDVASCVRQATHK